MTSPDDKLLATVVPGLGGETGVVDKNNNLQIEARSYFQFVDDKKYAYLSSSGIGSLVGHPFDLQ